MTRNKETDACLFQLQNELFYMRLCREVPETFSGRKYLGTRLHKKTNRFLDTFQDEVNGNRHKHTSVYAQIINNGLTGIARQNLLCNNITSTLFYVLLTNDGKSSSKCSTQSTSGQTQIIPNCKSQPLLLHLFNGLFSRTTWVSRHQKGKPIWILMKQEMMGWQWHQLDHMQIIWTSIQTDKSQTLSCLPTNFRSIVHGFSNPIILLHQPFPLTWPEATVLHCYVLMFTLQHNIINCH